MRTDCYLSDLTGLEASISLTAPVMGSSTRCLLFLLPVQVVRAAVNMSYWLYVTYQRTLMSVCWSFGRSVGQSVSQSVGWSVSLSVGQSVRRLVSRYFLKRREVATHDYFCSLLINYTLQNRHMSEQSIFDAILRAACYVAMFICLWT